jgi:hypothetical protein
LPQFDTLGHHTVRLGNAHHSPHHDLLTPGRTFNQHHRAAVPAAAARGCQARRTDHARLPYGAVSVAAYQRVTTGLAETEKPPHGGRTAPFPAEAVALVVIPTSVHALSHSITAPCPLPSVWAQARSWRAGGARPETAWKLLKLTVASTACRDPSVPSQFRQRTKRSRKQ